MAKFRVVTDGSADLPEELVRERDITVVPFYVMLGAGDYLKQGEQLDSKAFYDWMIANPGVFPKSSTPSTQDYIAVFEAAAQAGEPLLCVCITQKFSNSCQTASIARDMVLADYPDAQIVVMDSMVNTVLQGLFVLEACALRDAGYDLDGAVARLEEIRPTGRIFFTIGGIEYLAKGGRIGKLAGRVSAVLGIRPVITLKEGEIFPAGIVRGREKSLAKVVSVARDYLAEGFGAAGELAVTVGYGHDREEAEAFRARIEELLFGLGLGQAVPVRHIGAVIGVHTGPHPLGIGVLRRALP